MARNAGDSQPKGYQQLTVSNSAVGLTVPTGALTALIQCEGAGVRWRDDGTDPTATVGSIIYQTVTLPYEGTLSRFKVIRSTGADSIINIAYYG